MAVERTGILLEVPGDDDFASAKREAAAPDAIAIWHQGEAACGQGSLRNAFGAPENAQLSAVGKVIEAGDRAAHERRKEELQRPRRKPEQAVLGEVFLSPVPLVHSRDSPCGLNQINGCTTIPTSSKEYPGVREGFRHE
jgi:hypothetical protein